MKAKASLKVILLSILFSVGNLLYGQVLPQDSMALVELYNSTGGENWTSNGNWLTDDVSQWYGVSTGLFGEIQRVVKIDLRYNRLIGTLPPSMGDLTELLWLRLSQNNLTGPIPSTIGNLTELLELALEMNRLDGTLPDGIGNLTSLNIMWLYNNRLTGSIPDTISYLENLESLSFTGNFLSGPVTPSVGNLLKLEGLGLGGNNFENPIPISISNLGNLKSLDLSGNNFSGQIPNFIGALELLVYLDISNNQFTGTLPESFGGLSDLEIFRADRNQLSGEFPIGPLQEMILLDILDLSNNNFEGEIPSSINLLSSSIKELNLSLNAFTGTIPKQIGEFDYLKNLNLGSNKFEFCVDDAIPPNIESLNLANNKLLSIPEDFLVYTQLQMLSIDNNRLSFKDIIPILDNEPDYFCIYAPQDSLGDWSIIKSAVVGDFITLKVEPNFSLGDDDLLHDGNKYQWYKNGVAMQDSIKELNFYFTEADSGLYHARVTNPLAPELTLYTRPVHLVKMNPLEEFYSRIVVLKVIGDASLGRNGKDNDLREGTILKAGDLIFPGFDSKVILGFRSGATVTVNELTDCYIIEDDIQRPNPIRIQMRLLRRSIDVAVPEEAAVKSDFKTRTPTATCSVRGTYFGVHVDSATQGTTVSVTDGAVTVIPEYNTADSIIVTNWQQITVSDTEISSIKAFIPTSIEISPDTIVAQANVKYQFALSAIDDDGFSSGVAGNWSMDGGTIDSKGIFRAGTESGVFSVTVTEPINNLSDQAVVIVEGWAVGKDEVLINSHLSLAQNFPNPFKTITTINYQLPVSGYTTLKVFNILGEEVAELVNEIKAAGNYSIRFSAEELDTGTYYYKLQADESVAVKKMLLLK